jgi:hypothetical protein
MNEQIRIKEKSFNISKKEEFKNIYFRDLDHQFYQVSSSNILQQNNKTISGEIYPEEMKILTGDYLSLRRNLKFLISKNNECSILINDTINYSKLSNINFIEHMILHNNDEKIDPSGVYSDNVNISFFAFNKKLNIFSVYFDTNKNFKDFSIEYDFIAKNIIKAMVEKRNDQPGARLSQIFLSHNNSLSSNKMINSFPNNYNWFIWKIFNENYLKTEEYISIEVVFQLGEFTENLKVDFSLNFTKIYENNNNEKSVKYTWEGILKPSDLIILECKFPLFFEKCGMINVNYLMIFIGSVFIIFLIATLHMILSNVFFEDF